MVRVNVVSIQYHVTIWVTMDDLVQVGIRMMYVTWVDSNCFSIQFDPACLVWFPVRTVSTDVVWLTSRMVPSRVLIGSRLRHRPILAPTPAVVRSTASTSVNPYRGLRVVGAIV